MVQGLDMDNSYKIPQTAGDKEENSDSQKLQHSEVDQTRRKSHADDSATVKMLTQYNRTGVRWVRSFIKGVCQALAEVPIHDFIRETKIFLSHHPLATVLVASVAVACGVPIFIFVAFAVITILFTFGGFIIIEGAVLAAGLFALVMCLATIVIGFITVGFFGGLLYVTYMQIDNMIRLQVPSVEPVQPFGSHLPQVLASLRHLPNSSHQSRVRAMHSPSSSNNFNSHVHMHNSK